MKKRWFLRLSLVAILGTAGFIAFLLTQPPSPISRQNFEKIQVGMTLAEVEAIIGLPPGDYSTGKLQAVTSSLLDFSSDGKPNLNYATDVLELLQVQCKKKSAPSVWITDRGAIFAIHNDEKVCDKHLVEARRKFESAWQMFLGLFRKQRTAVTLVQSLRLANPV